MHCIDRAWERYGLRLEPVGLLEMERQIIGGTSVIVRRERNETVVHMVKHGTTVLLAVWGFSPNGRSKQIITFLPADAITASSQAAYRKRQDPTQYRPKLRRLQRWRPQEA